MHYSQIILVVMDSRTEGHCLKIISHNQLKRQLDVLRNTLLNQRGIIVSSTSCRLNKDNRPIALKYSEKLNI